MKHSLLYIAIFSFIILGSSCRKDFNYESSTGNLSFSKDTIYLDTVFAGISSSTFGFKVYNQSATDVEIPSIALAKGADSNYRLNVDGIAGQSFSNVPLFAKDSLYVFIEITSDASATANDEFLDTDAILFDSGIHEQSVTLVSLVKDAVFLYPSRLANGAKETILLDTNANGEEVTVAGFELTDAQMHFTNDKPYVIYGYAAVPKTKTLVIDAGARVHFHENSGILVQEEARLVINGTLSSNKELLENEVIFEGDRLEPEYSSIPGQWGSIWIAGGSINNQINHLTIKNATIGMLVEGTEDLLENTLSLFNSQIYNSQQINLLAKHAKIDASNSVIANAGHNSIHLSNGGIYNFKHNTIANYWSNGFRTGLALKIENFSGSESNPLTEANFINCIIDGNSATELQLTSNNIDAFQFKFINSLLKVNTISETNALYDFQNTMFYDAVLLNATAGFQNPTKQKFWLTANSAAINNAEVATAQELPIDIIGNKRTNAHDIGAYVYIRMN